MRRAPTRLALLVITGLSIMACDDPLSPEPITVPRDMVTIRPGTAFPPTSENRTEVHIGELKVINGQTLYETVGGGMLCIGGTAGCGLDGLHVLPSPVTLKTNVDYAIVLRSRTRRFTGHVNTGDEFFVFGQLVSRSTFTKGVQESLSDGTYPAGVFRIIDRRGTIQ